MKTFERVVFRLIQTPCCGHLLCWVNPRLPNYCTECGEPLLGKLKECIMSIDDEAILEVHYAAGIS